MTLEILIGFLVGIFIFILSLTKKIFFQVNEGNLAIVTNFGKIILQDETEKKLKVFKSGLHIKWPWQEVRFIQMMEQMIEITGEEVGITTIASDGTLLRIDSNLRITPNEKNLYSFLFSMERSLEHINGLYVSLLHQEIGSFDNNKLSISKKSNFPQFSTNVSSYATLINKKGILAKQIEHICKIKFSNNYGIEINGIDITDIIPPNELLNALNIVINSKSEAERLLALTEAECEQKLLSAQKGVSIAKEKAHGTEENIIKISEILNELKENNTLDQYIERRKCEVYSDAKISYIKRGI